MIYPIASINSGAPQQGGLTIVDGDEVQLGLASYTGVSRILWEIYSFPDGFATPAGWTLTTAGDRITWTGTTGGLVPPALDFTGAPWGKYLFRCTINGGYAGSKLDLDETMSEELAVQILGPAGLEDVAPLETNQFDAVRLREGAAQRALRKTATTGDGGGVDFGALPPVRLPVLVGNSTSVPTGVSAVALALDGSDTTAALLAGPLCGRLTTTNRVQVTLGIEVIVETLSGFDPLRDTFMVHIDALGAFYSPGDGVRLSEGSDTSGAHSNPATLAHLIGPASGLEYTLAADTDADTLSLSIAQSASVARTARVRCYWQRAEAV